MRSLLFVPAHKEKLIQKAFRSEADAIILDLEDSCPGEKNKSIGIRNIKIYGKTTQKIVIARISNDKEISLFNNIVDYIMYPKAEGILPLGSVKFILLVETALGVLKLPEIITDPRVVGVAFGNEDYKADTGCELYWYAEHTIMNCAKAYGKFAIDTVHTDFNDLKSLELKCLLSKDVGFDGKLCIHPKEIPIINECYIPTNKEYEYSKEMIELYDKAVSSGDGVAVIDGIYVAPPMVKNAKRIIEKYGKYIS